MKTGYVVRYYHVAQTTAGEVVEEWDGFVGPRGAHADTLEQAQVFSKKRAVKVCARFDDSPVDVVDVVLVVDL